MEHLGEGRTAEVFAYGPGRMVKLYRAGFAASACEREFVISRAVHEVIPATPAAYEQVTVEDRPGAVYERIDGPSMLREMLRRPWRVGRYAKLLARLQTDLHQKPAPSVLSTVHSVVARGIARAEELTPEERQRVLRQLDALPGGDRLCHFDFHPDNVLLSSRGPVIIDWNNALSGPPEADAARNRVILTTSPPPSGAGWLNVLGAWLSRRFFRAYEREYFRLSGLDPETVRRWVAPLAAARLREGTDEAERQRLLALMRETLQ